MATTYDFFAPRRWAHSLELNLDFERRHIRIAREFQRVQRFNGVPVPIAAAEGDTIVISFLILGHILFPRIPRAVFLHVAQDLPIRRPNELYELIQHHNRMKLLSFLRISDGLTGPLISVLRNAAFQQLETLSTHFGTRSLAANP